MGSGWQLGRCGPQVNTPGLTPVVRGSGGECHQNAENTNWYSPTCALLPVMFTGYRVAGHNTDLNGLQKQPLEVADGRP